MELCQNSSLLDGLGAVAYQSAPAQAECIWRWQEDKKEVCKKILTQHFSDHPNEIPMSAILILHKMIVGWRCDV